MAMEHQASECNLLFVSNDLCIERHSKVDDLEDKIMKIEDRHLELIRAINGKFTKIWLGIVGIMASVLTILLTIIFK